MGSLSLLQQIFPTQKLNQGLLHCRWILYLLSYQGSPKNEGKIILNRVILFAILWIVAYQTSLSLAFSRQEYWRGLPFPSPGILANPRIEPRSPALQADTLPSEPPREAIAA